MEGTGLVTCSDTDCIAAVFSVVYHIILHLLHLMWCFGKQEQQDFERVTKHSI
jgi:hypothetical protein